jgi:hypothetical protein
MSDTIEPIPAAGRYELRRAEHAREAYDAGITACDEAVGDALQYVAHLTSGIFDFALETPAARGAGHGAPAAYDRAGQQLSLTVAQLDAACQPLDSGPLIRVVVHGDTGALFQYLKFSGQNFFGIVLDGAEEAVERADRQMTQLAESAVSRLGAPSLNWGGFASRGEPAALGGTSSTETADVSPIVPYFSLTGSYAAEDLRAQACAAALDPGDLHYAGIYRRGQPVAAADIFDHPSLAVFFQRVTPELRRSGYAELMRQVQLQNRRFLQILEAVGSRRLVRLVLDVARGAIFVMPIDEDYSLIGLTLTQSRVETAERRFRALYNNIGTLGG